MASDPQQQPGASRPPARPRRRLLTNILAALGFITLALPLLLRLFVYEPFKVPAGSMQPTLLIGDHFLVERTDTDAVLGDVIVLSYPDNPSQQFVKRVVARGGDTIESFSGRLVLNDRPIPLCEVGAVALAELHGHLYLEKLTRRGHLILLDDPLKSCKQDADCASGASCRGDYCGRSNGKHTVPTGEVWMAGDNRNNSFDSFMWGGGAGRGVPLDAVRGRVGLLWWEFDRARGRIGTQINDAPRLPATVPASLHDALTRCLQATPAN